LKKGFFYILLIFLLIFTLAACGKSGDANHGASETQPEGESAQPEGGADSSQTEEPSSANTPSDIIIATGGTGGVYYPLGGEFATIFQNHAGLSSATPQVTGASKENMQYLSKGEVHVAFTQNDILDYAVNGTEIFDQKLDGISALGSLYPEIIQLVVSADSGIESIYDLKGKKVSVGAPGSGNEANSKQILAAAGLTYDDIDEQLKSYADSADAFKDGLIDAMFVTSGIPNSSVQDIAVSKGIRVLSLDEDVIAKLKEQYPFFIDETIPKETYQGQTEDAKTVAVLATLAVRSDLSEEFVYNLTKALFENLDSITHAKGKEIKPENALKGISVPVHPGAQKYYDEKGITK
jgi:hypothetical protein